MAVDRPDGPASRTRTLTRRQIYRRRRIAVAGLGALVLGVGFWLPFVILAPVPLVSAVESPVAPPAPVVPVIDFPSYGASGMGAVGYDGVLAAGGATTALPIASITKIVTALVVLDARPIAVDEAGPTITFGEPDQQFYVDMVAQDGIVAPVALGQTISQRNLLDVALMASANNYAQSLAAWAFGSEAAYVDAARAWLAAEGFTGTTIIDATGIQPGNTSTIADLIELGKRAVADPVISTIVATTTLDVPGVGTVTNRNLLLGIDGVDGIKTGTLDESGACLLFSQDITVDTETITIVGAVLGGPDHPTVAAQVRALLAQADAGFQRRPLVEVGVPVATWTTVWGDSATAITADAASAVVWTGTPITSSLVTDDLRLGELGADVGDLEFQVNGQSIIVDVELADPIEDPGLWWRLTNPFRLG